MRGTSCLAFLLFLAPIPSLLAQPPLSELPPVAPVQPTAFAPATTTAATAATTATPVADANVGREIKFRQGDPDPNLNPKPDAAVRQDLPPMGVDKELEPRPLLKEAAATFTWLPTGNNPRDFGVFSIETSATLQVSMADDLAPLLIKPAFGVHFWQQPTYGQPVYTLGLPNEVYDLYMDFGWRPRPAEWLFLDLGITPGFYTDFNNESDNGFRLRGRALGIFCFSEEFQIVAGAIACNRNQVNWLPAGGILYTPNPDTQFVLVFPAPKIAQRVRNDGCTEWWLYLAGEFGGGTWAVARDGWYDDSVDYNDWRVNLGFEWKVRQGISGLVEVGYVFNRDLYFANTGSTFDVNNTVMLRLGLVF